MSIIQFYVQVSKDVGTNPDIQNILNVRTWKVLKYDDVASALKDALTIK